MRGYKKYLFKNKWCVFSFFSKKRLLKFKHTKWKGIQSRIIYANKHYNFSFKFAKRVSSFYSLLKMFYLKKILKQRKSFFFNKKIFTFFKSLKGYFRYKKYKYLKKTLLSQLKFIFKLPLRKRKYKYSHKLRIFFYYQGPRTIAQKLVTRRRFIFKNMIAAKTSILHYYNGAISTKFFKKLFLSKKFKYNSNKIFAVPEFRLDLFLFRLLFFKSPYMARFAYQKNLIKKNSFLVLNKRFTKYNYKQAFKGGEACIFDPKFSFSFEKNYNAFCPFIYLPTIFDVDYYTNSIVILKDLLDLSISDLIHIIKEPLSVSKFKNYLLK